MDWFEAKICRTPGLFLSNMGLPICFIPNLGYILKYWGQSTFYCSWSYFCYFRSSHIQILGIDENLGDHRASPKFPREINRSGPATAGGICFWRRRRNRRIRSWNKLCTEVREIQLFCLLFCVLTLDVCNKKMGSWAKGMGAKSTDMAINPVVMNYPPILR